MNMAGGAVSDEARSVQQAAAGPQQPSAPPRPLPNHQSNESHRIESNQSSP